MPATATWLSHGRRSAALSHLEQAQLLQTPAGLPCAGRSDLPCVPRLGCLPEPAGQLPSRPSAPGHQTRPEPGGLLWPLPRPRWPPQLPAQLPRGAPQHPEHCAQISGIHSVAHSTPRSWLAAAGVCECLHHGGTKVSFDSNQMQVTLLYAAGSVQRSGYKCMMPGLEAIHTTSMVATSAADHQGRSH